MLLNATLKPIVVTKNDRFHHVEWQVLKPITDDYRSPHVSDVFWVSDDMRPNLGAFWDEPTQGTVVLFGGCAWFVFNELPENRVYALIYASDARLQLMAQVKQLKTLLKCEIGLLYDSLIGAKA